MGELEAAVVDRAVPGDEKLQGFCLRVGMEPEFIGFEMVDQLLERRDRSVGRSFFGHARQSRPEHGA